MSISPTPPRILFVCLGNICRSPTAEGVFRDLAARAGVRVETDSAGTGDWHIGRPPDRRAMAEAARRGHDISDLRARQFTAADFHSFDLILAMDSSNLRDIEALRPAGNTVPVHLMLDHGDRPGTDVPDPYMEGGFDRTFDLIETACRGLLARLRSA
ncbi:MAG: low molecular weight phosphotyrosine protein phosphatase [Rhodobacteraceae bacterium]|nr:low molecular weight phosphotyrosine protein phosphatase [Paracoccaceae bacterium]